MEEFLSKYKEILLFMLVYWFFCFIMVFQDGSFLYLMLSWNVLLAVLPLIFIKNSERSLMQGKLGYSVLWVISWLFFSQIQFT